MNRRQFLQALSAAGASIALSVAIADASDAQIDRAWKSLVKEPWFFDVNDSGTIEVAGVPTPKKWSDVYDMSSYCPRTPRDLISEAEYVQPLVDRFRAFHEGAVSEIEFRIEELEEDLASEDGGDEDLPKSAMLPHELEQLRARLARISDPDDGWKELVLLDGQAGIDRLWAVAKRWREESIDWDYYECLPIGWSAQGQAYRFFQSVDRGTLAELGVTIVEGDRPGSDYFAAELRSGIETANRVAERCRLPFRFRGV